MKIEKDKREVIIFTVHHKIEGTMYTYKDARILDELNVVGRDFIPLTNVKVFSLQSSTPLYESDFMAINKNYIIQLLPKIIPKKSIK